MKSSVGDLVFKHYFENVSTCTYTLDIVRKSLLHRVKTKLSNSAKIENSIYISPLLIPKIPSVSILDHRYRSSSKINCLAEKGPPKKLLCPKLTNLVFLEPGGGLKCILNFQSQLNLTILEF